MGRPAQSLLAPALGMIAALALASCGGNDAQLLPGGTARDITANLDTVRQLADEGDCVGAESAAQQVSEQVEALGGIDAKLKRALEEGAARLNEVVAGCDESTTEESTPTTAPTEAESTEGKPAKKKEGKEKQREEAPKEEETAPTTTETQPSEPSPPSQPESEGGSEEGSSGGVGPGTPVEGEG
jgi:septal ring-binding cell division protein DamX